MTDNDIVKALECCTTNVASCKDCPAFVKVDRSNCKKYFRGALDLINRLQAENEKNENIIRLADKTIATANAEIERLCAEIDELIIAKDLLFDEAEALIKKAKAEAYKEFAEKAKNEILNRFIKKSQAVKERSEKYNINTEGDVVSLIYNSEIIALNDAIEIIDSLKLNKKREEI